MYDKKEALRKRRKMAREGGVMCVVCTTKPRHNGRMRCEKCLESARRTAKKTMPETRRKLVEKGLCRSCGRPLFGQETINCMVCNGRRQEKRINNW